MSSGGAAVGERLDQTSNSQRSRRFATRNGATYNVAVASRPRAAASRKLSRRLRTPPMDRCLGGPGVWHGGHCRPCDRIPVSCLAHGGVRRGNRSKSGAFRRTQSARQFGYSSANGQSKARLHVRQLRRAAAQMAGPVSRLRRVEHADRDHDAGAANGTGARSTGSDRAAHAARPRRREPQSRASRPGSASSIACSAAGSCRAASCCSAAIPASASRRCCCARSRISRRALPTCYVTGEESLEQIGLRAQRLGVGDAPLDMLAETCVEAVLRAASRARTKLGVLAIDSIQTLFSEELQSAPGSVSQVRECAAQLMRFAKARQRRDAADRPRHEGGHARGTARARAHGRHRAVLRKRRRQPLPHRARRRRIASAPRTRWASS